MNTRLSHVKRHADIYAAPTTSSFILTKPSSFNRVISSWWLDCGVDNTTMTPLKLGNNDVAAKNTKKGNEIYKIILSHWIELWAIAVASTSDECVVLRSV